jgi:hypothetical protein
VYHGKNTKKLLERYGLEGNVAENIVNDLVREFIINPCLEELSGLGTRKVYNTIGKCFDQTKPYPGEMTTWSCVPLSVAQIAHILRALAQDHTADVVEAKAENDAASWAEFEVKRSEWVTR